MHPACDWLVDVLGRSRKPAEGAHHNSFAGKDQRAAEVDRERACLPEFISLSDQLARGCISSDARRIITRKQRETHVGWCCESA
jgi:hypothetical protein